MRKAIIDALLLSIAINVILLMFGVLFAYPWLVFLTSSLAYAFALVLRLRQAAHQMTSTLRQDPSLENSFQELSSENSRMGLMLYRGDLPKF